MMPKSAGMRFGTRISASDRKAKGQESSNMCSISTMKDMYEIVKESDKVVTF